MKKIVIGLTVALATISLVSCAKKTKDDINDGLPEEFKVTNSIKKYKKEISKEDFEAKYEIISDIDLISDDFTLNNIMGLKRESNQDGIMKTSNYVMKVNSKNDIENEVLTYDISTYTSVKYEEYSNENIKYESYAEQMEDGYVCRYDLNNYMYYELMFTKKDYLMKSIIQ